MRDLDDEFDSSDVVRYAPLPVREQEESTQPVDATMLEGSAFDDRELDNVLAALTEETEPRGRPDEPIRA